jgi:y4mF family transcriptional regulator
MRITVAELGSEVRRVRKMLNLTQTDLALTSGTGARFIRELEHGKATCHIGKVIRVLETLGIEISLLAPEMPAASPGSGD